MARYRIQTPLGRASGFGPAGSGFDHWWMERITAVALLPLTIWLAVSLVTHSTNSYEAFVQWLGTPVNVVLMILLLVTIFWHSALGLQVIIEDYIHSGAKIWALLTMRFICFGLAVSGIMATLRLTFIT